MKMNTIKFLTNGKVIFTIVLIASIFMFSSCKKKSDENKSNSSANDSEMKMKVNPPEWSKNATIYEVNIRQFTEEGTFNAFKEHLPRLKELGVDILWLMPIHPIGEKKRKGPLGSYYSVKDYKGVNPNFGTKEDFRKLVEEIHEMDMKIILDWVANHTAWDNHLINEHPEWYSKDSSGNFHAPVKDWTDVVDLNYKKPGLREYMLGAMEYWVKEFNIDGYRCDVAGMVPVEFWNNTRKALDKVKPVFMLAEDNDPKLHNKAFDMTYAWDIHFIMNDIAKGKKNATNLKQKLAKERKKYPAGAYRMMFTSNHDENSWKGSVYERLNGGVKTFAMLTYTLPGMPLIYNGQEACMDKRLDFFKKDTINWKTCDLTGFYKQLNTLKKENKALWNGSYGGSYKNIKTNKPKKAMAFLREAGKNSVFVVANLSEEPAKISLKGKAYTGEYKDYFNNETRKFEKKSSVQLEGWGYRVFLKE
jgi:glycosidase